MQETTTSLRTSPRAPLGATQNGHVALTLCLLRVVTLSSLTTPGLLDRLPFLQRSRYEDYFCLADAAFHNGQVEASTKTREMHWTAWTKFLSPLGIDPYLQDVAYEQRVQVLTGFAAAVRSGTYSRGRTVTAATVSVAITALGQTIALAVGINPMKLPSGDNKLLP